jgi:hypothetical protein
MSRLITTTTMTVDGVTDVGAWYVVEGEHDRAARRQFEGAAGMVARKEDVRRPRGVLADANRRVGRPPESAAQVRCVAHPARAARMEREPHIDGDVVTGVSQLKEEADGDLFLIGSGELARRLISENVVDEVRSGSIRRRTRRSRPPASRSHGTSPDAIDLRGLPERQGGRNARRVARAIR